MFIVRKSRYPGAGGVSYNFYFAISKEDLSSLTESISKSEASSLEKTLKNLQYAEVNIGEERIGELSFSPLSSLITISCGLIPKKEGEE